MFSKTDKFYVKDYTSNKVELVFDYYLRKI